MRRARLLLACALVVSAGACADDDGVSQQPDDPCEVTPLGPGACELGLGLPFTALVDGQVVTFELGSQGLWMFVVNTRVPEGDLRAGDLVGVAATATFDQTGETVALDVGCRARPLAATGDGGLQLDNPYLLPMQPALTPQLEGAHITIDLEVRDAAGHQARDRRSVVTHLPGHLR